MSVIPLSVLTDEQRELRTRIQNEPLRSQGHKPITFTRRNACVNQKPTKRRSHLLSRACSLNLFHESSPVLAIDSFLVIFSRQSRSSFRLKSGSFLFINSYNVRQRQKMRWVRNEERPFGDRLFRRLDPLPVSPLRASASNTAAFSAFFDVRGLHIGRFWRPFGAKIPEKQGEIRGARPVSPLQCEDPKRDNPTLNRVSPNNNHRLDHSRVP